MSPTSLLGLAQLGAAQLGQVGQVRVQTAAFEADGSATVAFDPTRSTAAAVQIDGSSTVAWTASKTTAGAVQIDGSSTVAWTGSVTASGAVEIDGSSTVTWVGSGTVSGAAEIDGSSSLSWSAHEDIAGAWSVNGGSTVSWTGSTGSVVHAAFHINGIGRVEWVPDGILPPGTIIVPNYETTIWVDWNLLVPDSDITEFVLTPSGVKWHYPMDGTLKLDFTVHAIGIDGHPSSMDVVVTMVYFRPTNTFEKHDIGYQTAMFSTYHALMECPYPDGFYHPPDIPWSAPFATIDAILVGTEIILSVQGVDPDDNPTTDRYLSGPGIRNSDGRRHWAKRATVDVYPGLSSSANNRVSTF